MSERYADDWPTPFLGKTDDKQEESKMEAPKGDHWEEGLKSLRTREHENMKTEKK